MRLPVHHAGYYELLVHFARDLRGSDLSAVQTVLRATKARSMQRPACERAVWVARALNIDLGHVETNLHTRHTIDGHRVTYWETLKCFVRRGEDHVGYTEHPLLASRVVERTAYGAEFAPFRAWAIQYVLVHCDASFATPCVTPVPAVGRHLRRAAYRTVSGNAAPLSA